MKFGTDGIRGLAGVPPIDVAGAEAVGRAAACWAQAAGGGRVLVMRDTRPSGAELSEAVGRGVLSQGGLLLDAGTGSSPAAAVGVCELADTGVMVTASHNAAPDNGFKVLGPGGRKPTDEQTAALEAWLTLPAPSSGEGQRRTVVTTVREAYRNAFRRAVGCLEPLAGRRVLVDLAHGGAQVHGDWLRDGLADELSLDLCGTGDGVINDGVGSEHTGLLAERVVQGGYDAGLAVDGDGDRCVLIDELGRRIPGDTVAWILTRAMSLDRIAVTVMSNVALEAALPGVEVVRTPVGDRHLAMAMDTHGIALGVEDSGHALFGDGLPGGDGLLTGLRTLAGAWAQGEALSSCCDAFQLFPRRLTKVRVSRRPELTSEPKMQALMTEARQRLGEGRVFLRYSGTEPVLRLLVEGKDEAAVTAVSQWITGASQEVLG